MLLRSRASTVPRHPHGVGFFFEPANADADD
jgi:hypothetical protein